ncbi:MAG: adenosine monophosphate-protein transferase [Rhodospirillales bacterium]|nr:adenosine monophosphate-protein transferase [Rhodospirillales bacterium]
MVEVPSVSCCSAPVNTKSSPLGEAISGALDTEDADKFVREIANFLTELNAIHPFREGNERSQLAFVALLGERAKFQFDFSRVRRDTFLPAMIASYAGNLDPLIAELTDLLR